MTMDDTGSRVVIARPSLASYSRAHPLQSRCTHLPISEWQCSSVPVECRPISPESLTCHLDWDSDHPPPTNWLFHLTTSLLSTGGPFQSPPPISGTVSLHRSPQHRRSRFSGSILRLFLFVARSCPDLIIWHSEFIFCCGPFCYLGHIKNLVDDEDENDRLRNCLMSPTWLSDRV